METSITLVQNPIIKHNLKEIGKSVKNRIRELELGKQVATEDSIKYLKEIRATLNKEVKEFEEQRKAVKDAVMNPYLDVETVYKEEIFNTYKEADELLKSSINSFELKLKTEKQNNLKIYFEEIAKVENLEWLNFDSLNLDITLSVTEKKYKEQIIEKVTSIIDDINLINTEEYAAEMLVEYKRTLKASQAIQDVRKRREKAKLEQEQIKLRIKTERISKLTALGFYQVDDRYNLNKISVSISDIENLSNLDWIKLLAEIKESTTVDAQIKAPVVEVKKETFAASFKVIGTKEELLKLKEFLIINKYNYKNI